MPTRKSRSFFFEDKRNALGKGVRFLETHEPSEETFRRLVDSSAFIEEKDDKATTSTQGFVKTVTDAVAKSNVNPDAEYSYSVSPSQLPTVAQTNQTIDTVVNQPLVEVAADSTTTRNNFVVKLSTNFINYIVSIKTSLTSLINALDVRVGTLETDMNAVEASAVSLDTRLDTAESDIIALEAADVALDTRLDTAESDINTAEADIDALQATVATLDPVGTMIMFGSATPPSSKWLLCNGQAISRTTYSALFAVVGTTWGVGDGSTTFNVPNTSGRFIASYNASDANYGVGVTGGSASVTLAEANLPTFTVPTVSATAGSDTGLLRQTSGTASTAVTITKSNTAIENRPQYIAIPLMIRALV